VTAGSLAAPTVGADAREGWEIKEKLVPVRDAICLAEQNRKAVD